MLFCKPTSKQEILYEQAFEKAQTFQLRSLNLKRDLNIIHQWMKDPYCRFRQPGSSIEYTRSAYNAVVKSRDAHPFIGLLDEQLICLIDVYRVQQDDLGRHIECKYDDCSMHVLTGCEGFYQGFGPKVIDAFMRYFFSFVDARYLYAEPDIHHTKMCRLLEKCGFAFQQNIMLDTKAASLYSMTRNQFHATHKQV